MKLFVYRGLADDGHLAQTGTLSVNQSVSQIYIAPKRSKIVDD